MPIKVLVINDSATARAAQRQALADEPDIEIIGELDSGKSAVHAVERLDPDVVLMDINMPDLDGYEVTRQVLRARSLPILMISANVTADGVADAMEALRAGAIAVLEAPPSPRDPHYDVRRRAIIHTIRSAAALPRRKLVVRPEGLAELPADRDGARSFDVVGAVASLGGPPVVAEILAGLGREHPPVLLVQHIEPSFVEGFAAWLRGFGRSRVKIAVNGALLERGTVYLALAEHHLGASSDRKIALSSAPPIGGFRPSGTHLLASLAGAYGKRALGIILTGMGSDGAGGAQALHEAGGYVIAQDEASCVVAGMVTAAEKRGAVDLTLGPGSIASHIR